MPVVLSGGVRIHYRLVGDGPPILLLHSGGEDQRAWELAGYLDRLHGWRCILVDRRGYGESDRPRTIDDYRMERQISDAIAVLDAVGVSNSIVWGLSWGGMVALALAATKPERVRALIVHDGLRRPQREPRTTGAALALKMRRDALGFFRAAERAEANPVPEEWMQYHIDGDVESAALEIEAYDSFNGVDPASISPPCLLLASAGSDEKKRTYAEASADMRRGSFAELPDTHILSIWRSDIVVPIVTTFLARVPTETDRAS